MRHQPRQRRIASASAVNMKPVCARCTLWPPTARRDVAGALAHAVALVARPVRQHDVGDAAGARVRHQRAEQEEVGAGREEVEAAAARVEAGERRRSRREPGRGGDEDHRHDQKPAENRRDEHPVQQLERALDALADRENRDAGEEGRRRRWSRWRPHRSGPAAARANRKKMAPAAVPAKAGQPTCRK